MNYAIRDLSPVLTDAIVSGLVVNKSPIRSFDGRGTFRSTCDITEVTALSDGSKREVFSFTLQDGNESIKCSCWGGMVIHANCFGVGDLVQVEYPDVKVSSTPVYPSLRVP